MIPLGAVEFSPGDVALILAVLVAGGIALALPATLTLAWIGSRRAVDHPGWSALWYWFVGTALSLATTAFAMDQGLGWWSVPIGWIPTVLLALVLAAATRRTRPESELGWGDMTTRQGER